MIESALALARQGFLVFPLAPGAKAPPLVLDWPNAATSDEATIRGWWSTWPDANVGVACDNLLVIDADAGKGGLESLAALDRELGLEATLEVETPGAGPESRGRHLYYRLPIGAAVRNGVNVLGRGLDIRANQNGYVVGAGSRTAAGEYRVYADEPLADAPPELIARVGAARVRDPAETRALVETNADVAFDRACAWLAVQPAAADGTRNHKGYAAAARCRDFGCTEPQALEAMLAHFQAAPPLDSGETEHVTRSAFRYAQDAAGKLTPEALGFEKVPESAIGLRQSEDTQTGADSTQIGYDRAQNEYNRAQNENTHSPFANSELVHPADIDLDAVLSAEYLIKGVLEKQSNAVLFGHWNVGKAQPLDELVLTPDGWRCMGDIKAGDYVVGSDGRQKEVQAVYPQGNLDEWEVEFHNGTTVRCCADHLWSFRDRQGRLHTRTTREFAGSDLRELPGKSAVRRWRVDRVAPVRYARGPALPVDPYLLGVLIGDGGLTNYVGLTTADAEVVDAVRAALPEGHILRHKGQYAYQIINALRGGRRNAVWAALGDLGLAGKKSSEKSIPGLYMRAAPSARLALLQGLMDTDGYATKYGGAIFAVSSEALAVQVKELVESLGGVAGRVRHKRTTHLPSHSVWFRLPERTPPFRLCRKAARLAARAELRQALTLRVSAIRQTGRKVPMQCISVAAADQLYVTRGFVLTHNTFVVLDMAAAIAIDERWFGRRVRQGRVLYLGYEGIRAMKKRIIALRGKYPKLMDRSTPFEWQPLRLPLTRPDGRSALNRVLRAYTARHGGAPDLIIIDPLANAIGGDDSDAMLMGALNECVAALIQKQHCTVLRVHHSGHGNQDRARGHSSLPAGVDTEIRVTEQEIALTKQRDDVRGKFLFKLEVVKLGWDSDGDDVTTCVVRQVEDNALAPELTQPQEDLLAALLKMRGDNGAVSKTDVRDLVPEAVLRRELIWVLERKQYLRAEGNGWVLCERGPLRIFD